jgi:O-acetylserine/cysteine efflux transporter
MLGYVVWASPFSVAPLLAVALFLEGSPAMIAGIAHADASTWAAVLWQAVGNTMFGYAVWGWLLARYPVASVAPMALLIPLFGIAASALWLGEPMQSWKLEAMALVLLGLFINVMWPKLASALGPSAKPDAL